MPEAQTQTEHKPARDIEMARLRAQVAYLKHALAYADTESMRKRSESAAMEELVQCQRRLIFLEGVHKKEIPEKQYIKMCNSVNVFFQNVF